MEGVPQETKLAAVQRVYEVAESLYLMSGHVIPDGRTFSRGLGEDAERCYQAAAAAYCYVIASPVG